MIVVFLLLIVKIVHIFLQSIKFSEVSGYCGFQIFDFDFLLF